MDIVRLRGIGVSPGIAMGEVSLSERLIFTSRREPIPAGQVEEELQRLRRAVEVTKNELRNIRTDIGGKMGEEHAFIFDAHILMLEDPSLISGMERVIREEKVRAEWAISRANARYEKVFEAIDDEYFRQRKSDVSDVLAKVYRNLEQKSERKESTDRLKILVAHDLPPSEAATSLSRKNVLAVALDMGGQTSHTAILARSLDIPAVVGLHDVTLYVKNGDFLIVDGTGGEVIVNPPPAVRREFSSKKEKYEKYRRDLQKTAKLESVTLDGVSFVPMANIELPDEVNMARSYGAEGVGLFRSEFIYLQRTTLATEDDHFAIYSRLAREAYPAPVYIRTIDIGGEKALPQLKIEKEPNPALGLRGIRFSLGNRDMFRTQLRAILRASERGNVRILFPMVTEIEEIFEVKRLLDDVMDELRKRREKFDEKIQIGTMIEVPAAASLADHIIKEVDYLSIGTNDLIQYYLAVDRSNEYVSYLYKPFHPAVLRLIRQIVRTAIQSGKDVTVCGEMAADPLSALVLLGFGVRKLSMNPYFIPRVKKALRSIEAATVEKIVDEAMAFRSSQEIEEYVIENILFRHPDVFLMGQIS